MQLTEQEAEKLFQILLEVYETNDNPRIKAEMRHVKQMLEKLEETFPYFKYISTLREIHS